MKKIKKGDMYWVHLNSIQEKSSVQGGLRLCLVLSNDYGNKTNSTILIAPATTKIEKLQSTHHIINKNSYNQLNWDTMILLEQTRVIDKINLGDFVIQLNDLDVFLIDTKLKTLFDIYNLKENSYANEINKIVKTITKLDGVISSHDKISFDIIIKAIETRDKRLNSLEVFCEKNDLNPIVFYREPPQLREIIKSYKNIKKVSASL